MTDALPPEIHHIAHMSKAGRTRCGIDMPPEQLDVRARGPVRICPECAQRFKAQRPPRRKAERGTL